MEKKISKETKEAVDKVFWGDSIKSDNCKDIDAIVEGFLNKEEHQSPDFRIQIALYNIAELPQWRVYDVVYGEDNPRKHSLETSAADALIQFMIYMKSMGLDIQKCMDLGIQRMTNRVYNDKKKKR